MVRIVSPESTRAWRQDTTTPSWFERNVQWIYWVGAAGLAPWIVYLSQTQHGRALTRQVHLLALGLIVSEIVGALATAWLFWNGSWLTVTVASFAATVTFTAAWFRLLTQASTARSSASSLIFLVVILAIIVLCSVAAATVLWQGTDRVRPALWVPVGLVIAALALLPSIAAAIELLPNRDIARHLRVAWTGLDIFELIALLGTALALHRRSVTAIVAGTVTGALLVCDAWINVIPTSGPIRVEGLVMALIELPLAALSLFIAVRTSRRAFDLGTSKRIG
ncbi:MAG: hypothetical protein ACYCVN_06670 [Acidimicrobiales bacterium]